MFSAVLLAIIACVLFGVSICIADRNSSEDLLTEKLSEMLERELAEYGAPEGSDGRH